MNVSELKFLESSCLSGIRVSQSEWHFLKAKRVKQRDRPFTCLILYVLGSGGRNEDASRIIFTLSTPFSSSLLLANYNL